MYKIIVRINTFHQYILVSFLLLLCNNVLAVKDQYDLIISKSSQELKIMNGEQVIKKIRIAYGSGGKGTKRILGDKKTPSGVYKIINFKDDSKFYYFMQIDYPNLLDAWYGYKNKIITANEFKNISKAIKDGEIPPQDTKLGGYIGIHGLGTVTNQKLSIHNSLNWTQGCIAMTNEEIDNLKKFINIDTRVIITE